MSKHKLNPNELGFSIVELIILICVIIAIAVGGIVVVGKNSSHSTPNQNKNYSSSIISYNLPYASSKTTITTLQAANKIVTTVNGSDIILSFIPNNQVDDIYATSGGLTVNNINGAMTKTITVDITEQLLAGTSNNQGLEIKIGNEYSYDDKIAPNAKLTHGPYEIKVRVSDTKGNQLYAYNSKIDF